MRPYVVLDKAVGQTPLEAAEAWRATQPAVYQAAPLAYAGRLDPMASGTLLILIGDECKRQTEYHHLDKGYTFSVLFGVSTDTADVLGRIEHIETPHIDPMDLTAVLPRFTGSVTLPYPHFSAKTVGGKPLHVWTLEGRLNEIEIPTKTSTVYHLTCTGTDTHTGEAIYQSVSEKIETVTPVTDPRKALGNDFRRPQVRQDWAAFRRTHHDTVFTIAHFRCIASSGTYMRTLATEIARALGTHGLAYAIHRTDIGRYRPLPLIGGLWTKRYR